MLVGQDAVVGAYDVALDGIKEAIQDPFSSVPGR